MIWTCFFVKRLSFSRIAPSFIRWFAILNKRNQGPINLFQRRIPQSPQYHSLLSHSLFPKNEIRFSGSMFLSSSLAPIQFVQRLSGIAHPLIPAVATAASTITGCCAGAVEHIVTLKFPEAIFCWLRHGGDNGITLLAVTIRRNRTLRQ